MSTTYKRRGRNTRKRYVARKRRRYTSKSFTQKVKDVIRSSSERKFHDRAFFTSAPVSGTSSISQLTDIDAGTAVGERTGESVYIDTIQIFGHVNGAGSVRESVARLVLFRAINNIEGSVPVVTELLTGDSVDALTNTDNKGDYKVYFNKRFNLQQQQALAEPQMMIEYYKRLKVPLKCYWDGTAGGIADAEKGHWFVMLMTNMPSGDQPTWSFNVRVSFKEMA